MTLERGERIEVVGLQREKQASNPILKKFSRVKKLCGRFFYALRGTYGVFFFIFPD